MPEEVTETETKEPEFQEASAADHLANLHGKNSGHEEPAPEPEKEPEVEAAAEPEKEPEPEKKEPEGEAKDEPEKPAEPEAKPHTVPLSVVQAERQKRQRAEAELKELKGQQVDPELQDQTESRNTQQLAQVQNALLSMSETVARNTHSDFQDKYTALEKTVAKESQAHPDGESSTLQMVLSSDNQGEAAYQAGKTILLAEKYGWATIQDAEKFRDVLKEEARAELAAERKEADTKNITKNLASRGNNPTDLSQARAAGGDESVEWHAPTAAEHLAAVHNRLR